MNNNFKEEFESYNGKKNEMYEYRDLNLDAKNNFKCVTPEDVVKKIENKETFIVYFGDATCSWCRSIVNEAVKSSIANDVKEVFYCSIWGGFHNEILRDAYDIKDKKAVMKKPGTETYKKLLKYLDNVLPEFVLSDDNGTSIDMHEKRISIPCFIYVKNGKACGYTEGISSKQKGYNDKLTTDILKDEKEMFDNFFKTSAL